jgi:hypothetical protein
MDEATARWLSTFARRRRTTSPTIETLETCPNAALDAARFVWHRRVVNEARSVELALRMRKIAMQMALVPVLLEALVRLEEDEISHVELARAVLGRLGVPKINVPAEATAIVLLEEPAPASWMRVVLTGLCICESVSAARFGMVREHTDLAGYRACIDVFYRDELTHAELGFVLLPDAVARLQEALGTTQAIDLIMLELRTTLGQLDRVIGLDFERKGGLPAMRPQPEQNPGVVEPALDAIAFYRAMYEDIVPRLETVGLPARKAWEARTAG